MALIHLLLTNPEALRRKVGRSLHDLWKRHDPILVADPGLDDEYLPSRIRAVDWAPNFGDDDHVERVVQWSELNVTFLKRNLRNIRKVEIARGPYVSWSKLLSGILCFSADGCEISMDGGYPLYLLNDTVQRVPARAWR